MDVTECSLGDFLHPSVLALIIYELFDEILSAAYLIHALHVHVYNHLPGDEDSGERAQVLFFTAGSDIVAIDL